MLLLFCWVSPLGGTVFNKQLPKEVVPCAVAFTRCRPWEITYSTATSGPGFHLALTLIRDPGGLFGFPSQLKEIATGY